MNVLSLFDGISCARVALARAGILVKTYYASEIDKHAIAVSTKNYPDIVRLGDVRAIESLPDPIDLLIGGSPCQDLSIAKKDRKGLAGDRSGLFWEYVRIKKALNPRWFILENVASMPKADRDIITAEMGVELVLFDAALVSAQSRKRLFWTNIPFALPPDRGIALKDILQPDADVDESMIVHGNIFCVNKHARQKQRTMVKVGHVSASDNQATRVYSPEGKSSTLSANGGGLGAKMGLYKVSDRIRKLTPIECERLQGLPDNYTEGIAKTNRYKCLGNGFNVDVVTHILKHSLIQEH